MPGPNSTRSSRDKSAERAKERLQEPGSRRATAGPQADILGLQRAAGNRAVGQLLQLSTDVSRAVPNRMPAIVPDVLTSSGGQPLDPLTRQFMESRFGYEFSHVRVHAGACAARSARALQARAYTVGTNIVFAKGRYHPHTSAGKYLLAHELAHVVQQSRGGTAPELYPGAAHEQGAEQAALNVAASPAFVQVQGATGVGIARQGDPEVEKAVEDALRGTTPTGERVEPTPIGQPARIGNQKALTPKELIEEHVFGPRVEKEIGELRKRLTETEVKFQKTPTDKTLEGRILSLRKQIGVLEGKPFDPELEGIEVPGHGRINTTAAIQVVDKDGNLIAVERGWWHPDMHAEEHAIVKLRRRLGDPKTRKLPPGSKIIVGGNQIVCSGKCEPALTQFAEDYGAESVEAHVKVRPAKGRVEEVMVSPKTAEKGALKSNTPPSAYSIESKTIYKAPAPEVPPAKPVVVTEAPAPKVPAATPPTKVAVAETPAAAPTVKPSLKAAPGGVPPAAPEVTPAPAGARQPSFARARPPVSLTSPALAEAQIIRARTVGTLVGVGVGLLAAYGLHKYREWMEQAVAAMPPTEIDRRPLREYLKTSAASMRILDLLSKDIDGLAMSVKEKGRELMGGTAGAMLLLGPSSYTPTERIEALTRLEYDLGGFQDELFTVRRGIDAALELEPIGQEGITAATELAEFILTKEGKVTYGRAFIWRGLVYQGFWPDQILTLNHNLIHYADRIRRGFRELHELQERVDSVYAEVASFASKLNRIYWSEVFGLARSAKGAP